MWQRMVRVISLKGRIPCRSLQGGSHEQHVKAGEQSHKNTDQSKPSDEKETSRGGTREQHAKAGEQSHKNTGGELRLSDQKETSRGGTHEQHVKAGEQSHKNN